MRITLNGEFTSYGAGWHSDIGEYFYNYSGDAGQSSSTTHNVAWYKPESGDAFNDGYQDTLDDVKAVLTIEAVKKSGRDDDGLKLIFYKFAAYDGVNNTPEDLYKSRTEAGFIGATQIVKLDGASTITVEITDPVKIGYLLENGIGFDSAYGNLYRVSGVKLALEGESNEDAPVIALDTSVLSGTMESGTYYHPAGDQDFWAGITYSQNLGTAMQVMRYTVKDASGAVVLSGETAAKSFQVPREIWTSLPASGSIELTAVSAHGIPSSVLVLPWVITHYNLSVSTPVSGSIIQSGDEVVLAWNLVLPEGMPSAPVPSRYTIWPAWDDEEEFQVAYAATERTYTIPAESLAGHTKLKVLVLDEYGTDGAAARAMDSGALVMLYLQPSAAVNTITVGTEYASGKYTPLLKVQWQAEGQTAFQITADSFDTGPVWGSAKEYIIPKIFDDGVHVIRLRIQDANGQWGTWSEQIYVNVLNRIAETVIFPEQKITSGMITNMQYTMQPGMEYNVYINGIIYTTTARSLSSSGAYLGNPELGGSTGQHGNEPFYIAWYGGTATGALFFKDASITWPVTIKVTESSGTVTLEAKSGKVGVQLSIAGRGDVLAMADVLLYRDGVLIAQLSGTETMLYEYADPEACGKHTYSVRMVVQNGFYAKSNTVTIDATPETDGILLPDGKWIALRYTQSAPREYRSTNNEETYEQHFAGRKYPVSMRSGRWKKTLSMEYIDKDRHICDALEAYTGAVVLFKSTLGQSIRGEINNVIAGRGKSWSTVSFRMSVCAEPEELQYVRGAD